MQTLFLGIDAGGTITRLACRVPNSDSVRILEGDGVNLQRDGMQAAAETLARLIDRVRDELACDVKQYVVCAGIAGSSAFADSQEMAHRLRESLGGVDVVLDLHTDAEIAFRAAFKTGPGILIIAGTGSILWARTADGALHRAGGWGFLLGDEGGGYRIGLAGLKALADSYDGGPATRLKAAFALAGLQTREDVLEFVYQKKTSPATLAPIVLDNALAGDLVAERIVRRQTLAIATRYHWLLSRIDPQDQHVVLAGGLSRHSHFRERLYEAIQQRHPAARFSMLETEPAVAALEWAEASGH